MARTFTCSPCRDEYILHPCIQFQSPRLITQEHCDTSQHSLALSHSLSVTERTSISRTPLCCRTRTSRCGNKSMSVPCAVTMYVRGTSRPVWKSAQEETSLHEIVHHSPGYPPDLTEQVEVTARNFHLFIKASRPSMVLHILLQPEPN